jgi:hypothetical protein
MRNSIAISAFLLALALIADAAAQTIAPQIMITPETSQTVNSGAPDPFTGSNKKPNRRNGDEHQLRE